MIELMITLVIVAIGVALAVPAWNGFKEKRQLTGGAEEMTAFIKFAQSEAIKRNAPVTIAWQSSGHSKNWCLGASAPPQTAPCDCMETVPTENDFCSIDGAEYRLLQGNFVDIEDFEFIHWFPEIGNFSFDPIRGTVTDISSVYVLSPLRPLFYLHSNEGSGTTRLYEIQAHMNVTGRLTLCTDDDRRYIVGGYAIC